ncbi:hypothetical protein P4V95_21685 [Bacillus thuringiensis]|nr:hypothetical protein [Bacillus thuringiensis]
MNPLTQKYVEEINFEQVENLFLTLEKIENLKSQQGVVCPTKTTDLWISRKLSVIEVLGIPTVIESTTEYVILDSFGSLLWVDDANGTLDYIKGFVG